jgi:NAD(P)H-dependent flavin oxidoreductase YrpB (nitropropane dioxygenase family)
VKVSLPIIQGGMGVMVSGMCLASAVSNSGGLGVLASVGLGEGDSYKGMSVVDRSAFGFRDMIRSTKAATSNPIGANIMCALTNYASLAKVAVDERVDVIISGAGLPLKLPSLVPSSSETRLVPIVSSPRAANLLCKVWSSKYSRLPDALIVEGPLAGGHLGFSMGEALAPQLSDLEKLVSEVLGVVAGFERNGKKIPVIAAGGIFDGKDIARFLRLGAAGVQMGSRFVCTDECDASIGFKNEYVNATPEDVVVIKSPVKMPLRVIKSRFVEKVLNGESTNFECRYHCLHTCEPDKTSYCIAKALFSAQRGDFDFGMAPCGANVHRIDKIVPVRSLMDELVKETEDALAQGETLEHSSVAFAGAGDTCPASYT